MSEANAKANASAHDKEHISINESRTNGDSPRADALYELRSLLLDGDPEQVLHPALTPEAVAKVLPAAILEAQSQQPDLLTSAVVNTVEGAIHASAHRDRNVLSDSLFPVIGPSTRKSISAAIGSLIQSLNQTLEYSLSWQSVQWRLEARRTGKTFAEVVLLRTLIYQVEQVFLIHGETGLVLQHVAAETAAAKDPDLVSAMLTAIQDFVQDSFSTAEDDALGVLEVGNLRIWIENGPYATLACVIRGNPPSTLHTTMQSTQENIHRLFDGALRSFEGDATAFEASRRYLEECFQAQFKKQTKGDKTPVVIAKKQKIAGGLMAGCLAVGLIAWLLLNRQANIRWNNYIAALEKEPGIVVIDQQRRRGRYWVQGLKDPLATEPTEILRSTEISVDKVEMTWQPYLSLEEDFISYRLQTLLNPPASVAVVLDDAGVLRLKGVAPAAWIKWAKEVSDRTAGINGWDDNLLTPVEWPSNAEKPEKSPIYFNAD